MSRRNEDTPRFLDSEKELILTDDWIPIFILFVISDTAYDQAADSCRAVCFRQRNLVLYNLGEFDRIWYHQLVMPGGDIRVYVSDLHMKGRIAFAG